MRHVTMQVIAAILEWTITGNNLSYNAMGGCLFTVLGVFLVTQVSSLLNKLAMPDSSHHAMPLAHSHAPPHHGR
jgi:hypothetical protein